MNERKPRHGDVLECEVDGLDARGAATARSGPYSVRLRGAVPGSRVRARVLRRRRDRLDAAVDEVLRPSPRAVEPRCPHFGTCGGCSFQGLDYAAQLDELGRVLARTLAPLGDVRVDPVLGCADPWHYRNKMDFTFGNRRWIEPGEPEDVERDFALGLHVPRRFDKVLDVKRCDIAFREATPIVASARALARELELDAWDVRAHRGLLRHLVLRKGFATGEVMAVLVTTELADERVGAFVDGLVARHPELTTVVQLVNDGVALVAAGEEHVRHGPGAIVEEVAGLSFELSAGSFFQTNTAQAGELVRIVLEEAGEVAGARALDLYCGAGLFALALARAGASVTGYEVVESAVEDARRAARRNGVERVDFVAGDVAGTLAGAGRGESDADAPAPDLCVVDPPRAGVHPAVLLALAPLAPRRVVYVSCNPAAAVRDVEVLVREGYAVDRVRPVDLFPHTPHLECVLTLERRVESPRLPTSAEAR